jgi:hypothetical protein
MSRTLEELARIVFDTAISSMDFGSGFLDNDEVDALRELAVLLGVDPDVATPESHRSRFCPGHQWGEWAEDTEPRATGWHRSSYCALCNEQRREIKARGYAWEPWVPR